MDKQAKQTIVVIGGDAAGMSAASQVKRQQPSWEVIVFEQGDYISYAACGMPYYIAGLIPDEASLIELTPEAAIGKRGIDLRLGHRVTKVLPEAQRVMVASAAGHGEQAYDQLLIATGSVPQVAGIDYEPSDRIFTLRDLPDMKNIDAFIAQKAPKSCAVVGGGYIGIEMAEAFAARGIETHLIHRRVDLARAFEIEVSDRIKEEMARSGVVLQLDTAIEKIREQGPAVAVHTNRGLLHYDFVFLGLGVVPATELAAEAGIELGIKGAIKVNQYLQTSQPAIYAAGDCVETVQRVHGQPVYTPLALKANKEGMLAGMNMAGHQERFPGVLCTSILKCFELGVARTGITSEEAEAHGLNPVKVAVTTRSRAGYYPGGENMYSLVIAEKGTGRVLGAQLTGPLDAVKRIDVYATAIHNKMTLDQIFELDLAYAPPFSPVYDPVLTAARVGRKAVR